MFQYVVIYPSKTKAYQICSSTPKVEYHNRREANTKDIVWVVYSVKTEFIKILYLNLWKILLITENKLMPMFWCFSSFLYPNPSKTIFFKCSFHKHLNSITNLAINTNYKMLALGLLFWMKCITRSIFKNPLSHANVAHRLYSASSLNSSPPYHRPHHQLPIAPHLIPPIHPLYIVRIIFQNTSDILLPDLKFFNGSLLLFTYNSITNALAWSTRCFIIWYPAWLSSLLSQPSLHEWTTGNCQN